MKKRKKLILMMAFMLPQKAMAASSSIRLSAKKATVSDLLCFQIQEHSYKCIY